MPIPIGILAGSKFTASGPAPTFYVDAGNASSYPGSGTTWTDLIASAAGTLNGPYAYDAASAGGAMNFIPNSWASYGNLAAASLHSGDWSMSVWVRLTNADEGALMEKGYNASGWMLWHYVGNLRFYCTGGARYIMTLTTSTWTHIVFRYQASSTSLEGFLNGVSQGAVAMTAPSSNASAFQIGRYATENIDGRITEARIWNTRLSDAEVSALWNSTKTRHGY